jgi:hypothetical protein
MKIIKRIKLAISFVSLTLIILFLAQTGIKEIDNPILLFIFAVFICCLCIMNGFSHGKLLSEL